MENKNFVDIPKEKFNFVQKDAKLHDKKFDTKPVGYFKDAFNRFKKNKGSIVAAWIVIFLILFALIGPYCFNAGYQKAYEFDKELRYYQYLTPKAPLFNGTGFWDGTSVRDITEAQYIKYMLQGKETGKNPIVKVINIYDSKDSNNDVKKMYKVRFDNYAVIKSFTKQLTEDQYKELQAWQNENNLQVIMPWVDYYDKFNAADYIKNSPVLFNNMDVWYKCDAKGNPLDAEGNPLNIKNYDQAIPGYRTYTSQGAVSDFYTSTRIAGDPCDDAFRAQLQDDYTSGTMWTCIVPHKWTGFSFIWKDKRIVGCTPISGCCSMCTKSR